MERRFIMSFHTERPMSTEAAIAAIQSRQTQRAANQRALFENLRNEKTEAQNQVALESIQVQTEQDAKSEASLDERKKKVAVQRAVKEATVGKLSLLENAKAITMNKVLFEMVYDAYWLDSNIKQNSVQETYNAYKETMAVIESTCGGSKTPDSNKSKFIKAVESVVEEVCRKATDRILQEAKETGNPDIQFNFTTEEESELDQKLSELGKDEIVELVRSKVLTVVQDEKRAGKEKAEMLKELETAGSEEEPDMSDPGETGVGESVTVGSAILTAAAVGVIIAAVAIEVKDKINLKKALKVYEKNCNPEIKMSQLHPKLYELDKAHRITDRELTGIKKFINRNSKRAKIWRTDDGTEVCAAILYTTTDAGVGAQVTSDGVSPTVNITTTYHYAYDVNPKFKKDELYITAMMAYSDDRSNRNTDAFTTDMKKAYPDDMKNMKVKLIGKSLESTSTLPEGTIITDSMDVDVVVDETYRNSIMDYVSDKVEDRESVLQCLLDSGAENIETESLRDSGLNEKDPDLAISAFRQYRSALNRCKVNISIMKIDAYSLQVKAVATSAIDQAIKWCDNHIDQLEEVKKTSEPFDTSKALNDMRTLAQKRALSNAVGSTLFESLMMSNTNNARNTAVTEGMSVTTDNIMNAALIESVLQYTIMETLNTTQLYNFTASDVFKLKSHNRSQLRK